MKITTDGDLLATVVGGDRYATTVELSPGRKRPTLASSCSCPVGISCKHAVATVAEYLQAGLQVFGHGGDGMLSIGCLRDSYRTMRRFGRFRPGLSSTVVA